MRQCGRVDVLTISFSHRQAEPWRTKPLVLLAVLRLSSARESGDAVQLCRLHPSLHRHRLSMPELGNHLPCRHHRPQ